MTAETKSEAFHRLATKRVDEIADRFRVFSNLCSPAYTFSADEVLAYAARLHAGIDEAVARFTETKCWRESPPSTAPDLGHAAALLPEPVPEPEPEPAVAYTPQPKHRSYIAGQISEIHERDELIATIAGLREQVTSLGGQP